jgi:hypothetical protein
MVGQAAFQAASGLLPGFTGRDLGVVVGASGTAGHAYLVHRDNVQSKVESPPRERRCRGRSALDTSTGATPA